MANEASPDSPARPEDIAALRNLYAGHRVVAFPEGGDERGRISGRGDPSKPRTRSLSAGRTRRPNDLVQDVYDRLGVSRDAPDFHWGLPDLLHKYGDDDGGTTDNNNGSGLFDPADFDFANAANNPFATNDSRGERNEGTASKFSDRFVSAASRGRQVDRQREAPPDRRSRSLSRGRVAQRWPPARQEHLSPPQETNPTPVNENTESSVLSPTRSPLRSRKTRTAGSTPAATTNTPTTSPPVTPTIGPTAKISSFYPRSAPQKRSNFTSLIPSVAASDLSLDNTNTTTQSTSKSEGWKDEKKEQDTDKQQQHQDDDQPPALHINPPSIKDRISAYGGKPGPRKKINKSFVRAVDKQYAAHFAVREHPPKVDIYERAAASAVTNVDDMDELMDEKKEEEDSVEAIKSTASDTSFKSNEGYASSSSKIAQQRATASATRNTTTKHRSVKTQKKIAESFLAAIQQPQTSPKQQVASINSIVSRAPVSEISAERDEHGYFGAGGTDALSLAMSSVSADDFALRSPVSDPPVNKKSFTTWYDRHGRRINNIQHDHAVANSSSHKQQSSGLKGISTSDSNNNINYDIQRMLDERVRAQVSDIETRLGGKMRRWMQQMDDKIAMRMEAMERKLQTLQNIMEEIQSRQEV